MVAVTVSYVLVLCFSWKPRLSQCTSEYGLRKLYMDTEHELSDDKPDELRFPPSPAVQILLYWGSWEHSWPAQHCPVVWKLDCSGSFVLFVRLFVAVSLWDLLLSLLLFQPAWLLPVASSISGISGTDVKHSWHNAVQSGRQRKLESTCQVGYDNPWDCQKSGLGLTCHPPC